MPNVQTITSSLTADKVKKLKTGKEGKNYVSLPDEGAGPVSVQYDFGSNVREAETYFGGDVIMKLLHFAISHPIQSKIRDALVSGLTNGKNVTTIQREVQAAVFADGKHVWKPGTGGVRKSAVDKEKDRLKKLDPAKRKEEIAALKALLDEME